MFADPLRSFAVQRVASAKICFLTAEAKSAWTFVTCALSIFPVAPKVQASTPTESLRIEPISPGGYDLNEDLKSWKPEITLRWFAPFFSGGGYSSEAISYVSELQGMIDLSIVQHGDSYSDSFVRGLPATLRADLHRAATRRLPARTAVEVCHSEPGAWSVPTPKYATAACPTGDGVYSVGRTMFETDRLPDGWAARLNALDEIWVPTAFHRRVFADGGAAPRRGGLVVVPEAVDVQLFDPARHAPLPAMAADPRYKFLSVFKWEARKGWDVLLRAFLAEFPDPSAGASLCIRASPYHDPAGGFKGRIARFAAAELGMRAARLDHVIVLEEELPLEALPRLYAGADAFVLPSRGEGWGRPHIEAMAMGLPAIATNWSGNTEFMLPNNSFLIPIEGLEPVKEGAFKGHLWASPSVPGLRRLLRRVFDDPAGARRVGQEGRRHVTTHYNPTAVGKVVLRELRRIDLSLRPPAATAATAATAAATAGGRRAPAGEL